MEFIETILFRKRAIGLLDDDELRQLQLVLTYHPDRGVVIPGSGGIRKLRWAVAGKGKKGGLRIIYYWVTADHKIYFITLFKKSCKEDLTSQEIKSFKTMIERES